MSGETNSDIIQYVPFMSFVHPSFWHTLTEMKLDVDKLNETTKQIFGRFSYRDDIGPVFEVDGTSFNSSPNSEQLYENVTGTLMNKNTIEEFKTMDKSALLNSIGQVISASVMQKTWIASPNSLLNFFIFSFADLKKFNYYYWFAFPSPSEPIVNLKENIKITSLFSEEKLKHLSESHKSLDKTQKPFFIISQENGEVTHLSKWLKTEEPIMNLSNLYFGFIDSSNSDNPGWPLRLYIAALLDHSPSLKAQVIKFVGLRFGLNGEIGNSRIYSIYIPENSKSLESSGWVGWERNAKGNFGPRLANMSASMDPIKLAETSSDLNIKLMKWRLVPNLDINVMKETKCLLLGAGTLGCHVARDLLAWGFRHITFIDNGNVSYSNPTRQILFNFKDCLNGGRKKAEAAADNLKLILPSVISKGIPLHIPMPGHPVGDSLRAETISNIEKLTQAIAEHDVIFLLLDTREARWLPTLLAAHYGKIVINAALGFDSYMVIRHGTYCESEAAAPLTSASIRGVQLGCYFCNDVTAPGNSLRDRTLDQQCTVTRPGAGAAAAAFAVELLAALLQHPLKVDAPAVYNLAEGIEHGLPDDMQGVLGPIPHSIRGFLYSYQMVTPTCVKFSQCIGCSKTVISKYREEGIEFILKTCESGKYLEEVTGLAQLHLNAEMTDVLSFSDEDDDEGST